MATQFHYLIIASLIVTIATKINGGLLLTGQQAPVFQVIQWLEADDYQWRSARDTEAGLNHNSTTLVVPGDIAGIVLECNASYPVEILYEIEEVFDNENLMMMYSVNTKARREVSSLGDESSFKFSMKYQLYATDNKNTGTYICQSTANPEVFTKFYIMWEGNSPPYLIGAKNNLTISTYNNKKFITLPCYVSTLDVDVILEKEVNITHETNETSIELITLLTNESIIYDPTFGYQLNVEQLPGIEGIYKCSTEELEDVLYINVTSEPPPEKPSTQTTRRSEKTILGYNSESYSLYCCSNSPYAPKLVYFMCSTPTVCKIMKQMVIRNAHLLSSFGYGYGNAEKNCTSQHVHGYSGIAVCKGDGIDTSVEVFFPLERMNQSRLGNIYLKWSDAKDEEENLLRVHALNISTNHYRDYYGRRYFYNDEMPWPENSPMYSGQNVSFRCETSPYYFATGVRWEIEWKNSTKSFQDSTDINDVSYYMYYWIHSKPISIIVNTEMKAVIAYAPVWNESTKWVTKKYDLSILEPAEPTISSSSPDFIYWNLNETDKVSIECKSEGDPAPYMYWTKHGKLLESNKNMQLVTPENGTLELRFTIASYDVHGDYTCFASNLAGQAMKTFTVVVEEPHPWTLTIVITVVGAILLLAGGVLIWRIKVQRRAANASGLD